MGLEAVGLDDEALLGPAEVGRDAVEALVDERPWQFVGIEEGEEAALEPASGVGRDDAVFLGEPLTYAMPLRLG